MAGGLPARCRNRGRNPVTSHGQERNLLNYKGGLVAADLRLPLQSLCRQTLFIAETEHKPDNPGFAETA